MVVVGVPHPVRVGGTPGTPPPSRPGMGYPPTIQTWDGVPPTIQTWDGVPPTIQTWDGVPSTIQTWDRVPPPPSRPGTGYPPTQTWDGVPPYPDLGRGTPPPPMVKRQTFPSINITFPRTTYTGGKNKHINQGLSPRCFIVSFSTYLF